MNCASVKACVIAGEVRVVESYVGVAVKVYGSAQTACGVCDKVTVINDTYASSPDKSSSVTSNGIIYDNDSWIRRYGYISDSMVICKVTVSYCTVCTIPVCSTTTTPCSVVDEYGIGQFTVYGTFLPVDCTTVELGNIIFEYTVIHCRIGTVYCGVTVQEYCSSTACGGVIQEDTVILNNTVASYPYYRTAVSSACDAADSGDYGTYCLIACEVGTAYGTVVTAPVYSSGTAVCGVVGKYAFYNITVGSSC